METVLHTDVLVLGGGSAGMAAAIAASRKGLKVTLVERNAFLGGKATAAEVGTICGLYHFSKKEESEYVVNGFAREFADALQQRSATRPLHNAEGLHYLPYHIDAFKQLCVEWLHAHQVHIHFNAVLKTVETRDDKIMTASVIADGKPFTIFLKSLIDCSGDSVISGAAHLPVIKTDHYQAAAQVFTMQGVAEDNEARLGLIMMKALRAAIDDDVLPDFYDRVYVVQGSLRNNQVSLKVGLPLPVTYAPGNLQELKTVAESFVQNLAQFLVNRVAAFKQASIQHIAPEVGTRTGLRSVGRYVLTEEDVLQCRKFDDAVANGSWPIEEWVQHRRVSMSYFNEHDYYQVPAACLQSASIQNLFFAGRNISATEKAIASARVMGICLQTGYAAGCLAAAFANNQPQNEEVKQVQNGQL
ncbi:MAG TPA: FAD-dependent oxidoreductase [Ferruginibacter sp.]|nr:hypothetical protein [Chitinophagaceae bacterium]HRI24269.1 FAD-dependent oxidoreductase [Ferruginibacter sp.]